MTKFINIIFAGTAITLASCNVYKDVQITKEKSVNFGQYETYAWLPEKESTIESDYNNDFIRQKTRNYFGHCMVQRQLKSDSTKPQLLLQIEWLSHAREVEVPAVPAARETGVPPLLNAPNYYDTKYYNAPTVYIKGGKIQGKPVWDNKYSGAEKVVYAHGGAKLTAIDRQTNRIVWEGLAQGDLYDPNIMYKDLHPAIHKMMKKFPIKIPKKGNDTSIKSENE